MPAQYRVRPDNSRDLSEGPAAEPCAEGSEASPVRIRQMHALSAQLRLQHQVLGSEVLYYLFLLARAPSDERREHQMQRTHTRESARIDGRRRFGQNGRLVCPHPQA